MGRGGGIFLGAASSWTLPGLTRLGVRPSWRASTELCPQLFTPCFPHRSGKAQREAILEGFNGEPRARRGGGGGGGGSRKRAASGSDEEEEVQEAVAAARRGGAGGAASGSAAAAAAPDEEEGYAGNRWSAIGRAQRYRQRQEDAGEDADALNPLPGFIDPITLEPVINPAMSPSGEGRGGGRTTRCRDSSTPSHWSPSSTPP